MVKLLSFSEPRSRTTKILPLQKGILRLDSQHSESHASRAIGKSHLYIARVSADNSTVTFTHADVQRTGWLFTRGNASVRMTVEEEPARTVLLVRGPGTAAAAYDFPDLTALMEFAALQESQLQEEGFQLQAIAERRSDVRRVDPRPDFLDRRRR
jgi:hypothetical protein